MATPVLDLSQSASPIDAATVGTAGVGYIKPPVFWTGDASGETLSDFLAQSGKGARFQAYLKVTGSFAHLLSGGSGYSAATTAALVGGMPLGTATDTQAQPGTFLSGAGVGTRLSDPAANAALNTMACLRAVAVLNQGRNYSGATQCLVLGDPPPPGGRKAVCHPIIVGGKVIRVLVVDPGMGYIRTPTFGFFDPAGTGSGAVATANMVRGKPATLSVNLSDGSVGSVGITDPGDGYVSVPDLVIFDPGGGFGAEATVGPVIGGAASLLGVSRLDVMARGKGYTAPVLHQRSFFEAAFLVGDGDVTAPFRAFFNLMKTQIQNALSTEVTETVS